MVYSLRPATPADAQFLAPRLCAADRAEIAAGSGLDPLDSLLLGLERSMPCAWVLTCNDAPFLMGGVVPHHTGAGATGLVWMLATDELARHRLTVRRLAPRLLSGLLHHYERLGNLVSAQNTQAVRWLRSLGFTVHSAKPLGISGAPFHLFLLERPHV